ncbi:MULTISPECIES: hypothetical protein [Hyphobacterium]|uniref:Uncharacterized protein n=1 Tax=Hyphobacterium vulgare TaxID=1736751 RepID=A0ABV7A0Z0_9PROT
MDFADLFHSYWWLLFPLAFFLAQGWSSFMRYKRTKAKIELLKSYAAAGKEPPADLVASIDKDTERDDRHDWTSNGENEGSGGGSAFLVFLFAGLAGVFAYAGWSGLIGDVREEFYFIAMILGVLAVAFLASAVFRRRK